MKLSLRTALSFGGLTDATVVAGEKGLDCEVNSVSILEIAEPMVSQWVSSGELYISSLYSIPHDIDTQKSVIHALSSCGCSGLIIGHLGLWFDEISKDIISLCDEINFPLIVANPSLSYLEILNPIYKCLMDWDDKIFPGSNPSKEIVEVALNERNIYEALKKISVISNCLISYFDNKSNCIYSNKSELEKSEDKHTVDDLIATLMNSDIEIIDGKSTVLPIHVYGIYQGCLVIDNSKKVVNLEQRERLKIAYSFILSGHHAISADRYRNQGVFIEQILQGAFLSETAALEAAKSFKIELAKLKILTVIKCNPHDVDNEDAVHLGETLFMWYQERIKSIIKGYSKNNILYIKDKTIVVLLEEFPTINEFRQFKERLELLFEEQSGLDVSIGFSYREESVMDFPNAFDEATAAAEIGSMVYGYNHIIEFSDIWVFKQFYDLRGDAHYKNLSTETLKKLLDSGEKNVEDLLATLQVLIECNDNITEASQRMFVHRNTIVYRRKRIIEILEESPFKFPNNFKYYLAMCAMK